MTEIVLDARIVSIALIILGVLLIAGAFIALLRSNSKLRRKIRAYEDRADRERSYDEFSDLQNGYYTDPSVAAYVRSPRPSYPAEGLRQSSQYQEKPNAQVYESAPTTPVMQDEQYSSFSNNQMNSQPADADAFEYRSSRQEKPAYFDIHNAEGMPSEEPISSARNSYTEGRSADQSPVNRPFLANNTLRDGIGKVKAAGASTVTAEKENLKNLKQLLKAPITSDEDAAARKKIFKRYMWILLCGAVLFSVLMNLKIPVLSALSTILGLVCFLLLFADILLLFVISKSAKAINERSCPTCKTQFTNENVVSWHVINVSERLASNERNANLREYTTVGFECVCPRCGAEKRFAHEFCTANITASGKVAVSVSGRAYPLNEQIKDYFDGHLTIVV